MNWLDGLETFLASSPLMAFGIGVVFCVGIVCLVMLLFGCMAGAQMPWPRRRGEQHTDWLDTLPVGDFPAPPGMEWGTLGTDAGAFLAGRRVLRVTAPPRKSDCCGECDGSQCGDAPRSASTMTPTQLREAMDRAAAVNVLALQKRRSHVPPRRNPPQRPAPAPAPSAAPSHADDSDDTPYAQALMQVMRGEEPAPTPAPEFRSGLGGEFTGGGASASWDAPADESWRSSAPSPSYDGSSSSSDCGSSDSGGGCGGGD